LLLFLYLVNGELLEGVVKFQGGIAFLGKFSIDIDKIATVSIELRAPQTQTGLEVWAYDDQEESWLSIFHKRGLSCIEKKTATKGVHPCVWSGDRCTTEFRMTGHARPRFWYITAGNCENQEIDSIVGIQYSVHFLNSESGAWNREFGVNEMGLNTWYLIYFVIYSVFVGVHSIGAKRLEQTMGYIHNLVKLFSLVLFLQYGAIICKLIHYCVYTINGKGFLATNSLGEILEAVSRAAFILLLMLLAIGWTISSDEIKDKNTIIATVASFSFGYLAILLYQVSVRDPSDVSIPPWSGLWLLLNLVTLEWFCLAFWFAFTIFHSYEREYKPAKKALFARLGWIYTPWFLVRPVSLILVELLNPWVRDKIVISVSLSVSTLAYLFLAFLLWPSRAGQYFDINTPDITKTIEPYEDL